MPDPTRDEAEAEAMAAGRALGAAAVLFHAGVAARMGLTAVEEKALDVTVRLGPVTAGELASATGLAPSSVTALIDRLVRKGYAERVPDTADARRVRVAPVAAKLAAFRPLFDDFVARLQALNGEFTPAELALAARYMRRAAEVQQAAAARLDTRAAPAADP